MNSYDDCRCMAAESLLPAALTLLHPSLHEALPNLITVLWEALQCGDELSVATNPLMTLLIRLYGDEQRTVQSLILFGMTSNHQYYGVFKYLGVFTLI